MVDLSDGSFREARGEQISLTGIPVGSTLMVRSKNLDRGLHVQGGPTPRDVKKAIEYMRRNVHRKISVADLATAGQVAERTLRKHFRAFIGLSPLGYWRRLRLAIAREELLKGASGASVTEVATLYGFSHFGRFALQYRRCFGEAPSTTLSRGRAFTEANRAESIGARPSEDVRLRRPSQERPSIAVLPCETSALEPSHRFLAECLAEGLATELCRVRSLLVLMPKPSQLLTTHDRRQVARELGARYFLVGRLAQTGERLRIIVRLLDTDTGVRIVGDSYDGEKGDLFGLQDRITASVVKAILPNIRGAEFERARRKRPEDLDVYDLTMRAFPFLFAANPRSTRQALDLLHRAMQLDPDFALSTALAAFGHAQLAVHNGTRSPGQEKSCALELAERAAILGPDDSQVLTARCAVNTIAGQFEVASALIARALALDPTSAWAWERSGWLQTFSGQPAAGIANFGKAMRLDPLCVSNANRFVGFGCAHFDAGRYEQAALWMQRALREQPSPIWVNRTLSVTYARLGERSAARESLDALRHYCPDLTVGQVLTSLPFSADFMARVANGLGDLGLPP